MKANKSLIAACLVASFITAACGGAPTDPVVGGAHDHAGGSDHDAADHDAADHDHGGDEHEGTPVVLHNAALGPYSKVAVTFLRPSKTPVMELAFEIELVGPSSSVRGTTRSVSGALSLTGKAEAEDEPGHFHLHVSELPADLEAGGAVLVLSITPDGGAPIALELPLDA